MTNQYPNCCPWHEAGHRQSKEKIKNLTGKTIIIIDPETHAVVREFPPEGDKAFVIQMESFSCPPVDGLIPVVTYSRPYRIIGLSAVEGDIIVPPVVADAMRVMGQRHRGRVYTPMSLIFGDNDELLETSGLIVHPGLKEEEEED